MAVFRKRSLLIYFIISALFSCHNQKEIVSNDNHKAQNAKDYKTMPGSVSMSPGTFGAVVEVISVNNIPDSLSHYMATALIRSVKGRGSALTEIVSAGDTINCVWPGFHANDALLNENIAKRKLMETVIEERLSRNGNNNTTFVIRSFNFKQ